MSTSSEEYIHRIESPSVATRRNTSLQWLQERHTLAQSVAVAIDREERNKALSAILKRLDDARREHTDHYLAQRLRRETSQELS